MRASHPFCTFIFAPGIKTDIVSKLADYCTLQIGISVARIEEKDRQTQLLCYVSLIRGCNKVLYQLVYIGKKFVFLKKNLGI